MDTKSFLSLRKTFSTEIEKSIKNGSTDKFRASFEVTNGTDVDKKAALDQSFRDILLEKLIGKIPEIEKLIDFAIICARASEVTATVPIVLLSDAFDVQTLEQCEDMFAYVERNVQVWKEEFFFAACKNSLLRMCNDLLRRLSRSQNTVFCGRILLFLANFFPFSERSGLNIASEFNLDNITEYGMDGNDMGVDEIIEAEEEIKVKIDYNLYCKFWALQDFFRDPNQCYDRVRWKVFEQHTSNVLAAFASCKLEETTLKKRKLDQDQMEVEELEEGETSEHHFFAKFLTNPKLLSLQLSDPNFRRSVLVQFLIIFQYLTITVKFKPGNGALNAQQTDWVKDTELQIYKLLHETPPNGKKFSETVRHMLNREEIWNNWKNEGCKEFKRPELLSQASVEKKKGRKLLGDLVKDYKKNGKFYLGNPELTRLWNICPDNLQACRGTGRDFLPTLEDFLESDQIQDSSFEWRALRLLARQSTHFFTVINSPSTKISDYLDIARKRIKKEKEEKQPETAQNSEETQNGDHEKDIEAEMEAELMKTEAAADDDKHEHKEVDVTPEMLKEISEVIGEDWKKLGAKLGRTADEIVYYETENPALVDQCKNMLQVWFADDEDATLDNLAYILEGLEMNAACEITKKFIDEKVEIVSD